jgi:hypothetical protein
MATATLELPLAVTISALRAAGTGDSLLAALDVLVNVTDEPATAEVEVVAEDETAADEVVAEVETVTDEVTQELAV